MIIEKYICDGCKKTHERRIYKDKAEMKTILFMENIFPILWEKHKQHANELSLEEFCKRLVEISMLTYHKNSKSIRKGKDDIFAIDYHPENQPTIED